jgi:hypothetical protein
MAQYRMNKPFSTKSLPLSKRIMLFLISGGALGAMLTFLPYGYHPVAFIAAFSLIVIGFIAAIYADRTRDWRAIVVFSSTFPSLLFAIGGRALISQLSHAWLWVGLFLVCYLLAWLIPALAPKVSSLLFKEQMNPQTRLGQAWADFFTRFSAVLMGLGPAAGLYLTRYGHGDIAQLIIGNGMCLVAILFGQIYAHQLWNDRPWAKQEKKGEVKN